MPMSYEFYQITTADLEYAYKHNSKEDKERGEVRIQHRGRDVFPDIIDVEKELAKREIEAERVCLKVEAKEKRNREYNSKLKVGDIVTLESGKPFKMSSDIHILNPVYFLKINDMDCGQIWLDYKLGWIKESDLKMANIKNK